jgi:hypothetical protein
MGCDPLLVDQPVEVRRRPVGRIGSEPLGLDVEAFLGALDHGLGRAHFRLTDGARSLDIHDDAEPRITGEGLKEAMPARRW